MQAQGPATENGRHSTGQRGKYQEMELLYFMQRLFDNAKICNNMVAQCIFCKTAPEQHVVERVNFWKIYHVFIRAWLGSKCKHGNVANGSWP